MTLIDYAKYLLSACGRRFTNLYRRHYLESTNALPSLSALLSYLKTQTATIYAYLQSRLQGDPTSGIPSVPLTTPLTLANLLTNIQKLSTRKIDAGASTQIPEGISLVRLLCDTTAASAVTELIDTNSPLVLTKPISTLLSNYPNLSGLTANIRSISGYPYAPTIIIPNTITKFNGKTDEFIMPDLVRFEGDAYSIIPNNNQEFKIWSFPNLEYSRATLWKSGGVNWVEEIYMPKLTSISGYASDPFCENFTSLKKCVLGNYVSNWAAENRWFSGCTQLLHLEICASGGFMSRSIMLNSWSPTLGDNLQQFLTNFRQYIFLRLADRTATTALTLTLSSAVYTALTTETSTLAELGITTLTDKEQAAGITLATAYNTWLDTYRAAINWNITNAG